MAGPRGGRRDDRATARGQGRAEVLSRDPGTLGAACPAPLVLTLTFDGATFARLDGLRRRYFPPARNLVPAHLTLFHALPGEERARVATDLAAACAGQAPFRLEGTGLRSLGRGVAVAFASPPLAAFHRALQREWRDGLTPQDSARLSPHVTVQNKVSPAEARRTLAELGAGFVPFAAAAEGVELWSYLGGPWRSERRFRFTR